MMFEFRGLQACCSYLEYFISWATFLIILSLPGISEYLQFQLALQDQKIANILRLPDKLRVIKTSLTNIAL